MQERAIRYEARIETHTYLAQAYEASGQKDDARKTWRKVLQLTDEPHPFGANQTSGARDRSRKLAEERLEALKGK